MKLSKHQEKMSEFLLDNKRCLVDVVLGDGHIMSILWAIGRINPKQAVYVCKRALVYSRQKNIKDFLGIEPLVVSSRNTEISDAKIIIISDGLFPHYIDKLSADIVVYDGLPSTDSIVGLKDVSYVWLLHHKEDIRS